MKSERNTRIIVETERFLVISRRDAGGRLCAPCAEEALMITVDEAAAIAQMSSRSIYRLVESAQLHSLEPETGLLLVCFNSLRQTILAGDAVEMAGGEAMTPVVELS